MSAAGNVDSVTLSGNAANVLTVSASPASLTANQNAPVAFSANVDTSLADTYEVIANAPAGWAVTVDGNAMLPPRPPRGCKAVHTQFGLLRILDRYRLAGPDHGQCHHRPHPAGNYLRRKSGRADHRAVQRRTPLRHSRRRFKTSALLATHITWYSPTFRLDSRSSTAGVGHGPARPNRHPRTILAAQHWPAAPGRERC